MNATPVLPDDAIERALVIVAHPDDVDFGAAGTIATWTAAGIEVVYCICTDGQEGGFDESISRSEIPRIRRAEQIAAAGIVGVQDVRFLGRMDGALEPSRDLVQELTALIRDVRPDRALIQSPERIWDFLPRSHPDHLAAGEAAIRAIYPAAQNPYAFPDLARAGLAAWNVREVWLAEHPTNNHVVDITETFDAKMAALLCHESQHPSPDGLESHFRGMLGKLAADAGLPTGSLAEAFAVYRLP